MINMAVNKPLDVFYSAQSFQEEELRNKSVVIIDVLRASSTIVTALNNGAKSIIPVADMGEASKIAQNVDSENYLLCRSEEHTSELQSRGHLVCRLLLEKKTNSHK